MEKLKPGEYYFVNKKLALSLFAFILIVGGAYKFTSDAVARKGVNCGQFQTYDQAKTYYDQDPIKNRSLDKDHDGVPCEDLLIKQYNK